MHLFNILLIIHIVSGSVSLLLGMYILLARKGGKRHIVTGNIFFYAMLSSAIVALVLSYLHPNTFLFIIGIFTSYLLLSGRQAINKKTVADVRMADWAISLVMLLFALFFIVWGSWLITHQNYFGTVLLVFSLISLRFVIQDYKNFKGRSPIKNNWLVTHLQRMVASYIASVTAFLVVNNSILPGIMAWLLPTVIFTPLIVIWSRKYKGKKMVTL